MCGAVSHALCVVFKNIINVDASTRHAQAKFCANMYVHLNKSPENTVNNGMQEGIARTEMTSQVTCEILNSSGNGTCMGRVEPMHDLNFDIKPAD